MNMKETEQINDNEYLESMNLKETKGNIGFLDELDEVDKYLIRRKLEEPKVSGRTLADELDLNENTIYRRFGKDKVKRAMIELNKSSIEIIQENQVRIIRKILARLESSDEAISLRAAISLLNKVVPDKKDITGVIDTNINVNITSDFVPDNET